MNSRLSFFIILLIGFVDYLGIGLVYPIFAVLLFDNTQPIVPFDSSPEYRGAILGILIALTPISQFFCSPILGAFSDMKGRRVALIIGIAAGCVGYVLAVVGFYANSLALLFLYRILVGASDATAAVAQATLADISTEENKAKRFAYLNSSFGFGFTLGPFLGGIIADPTIVSWFDYSTPLIAAGLMSLMNLLFVIWLFPETRKKVANVHFNLVEGVNNIRKVFLIKNLKWLFFAGFALSFGWAFFNEFIPVLLRERFEFTLSSIGEFYAFTGIWYAIGALLATRFIHKFSPEKIAIVSLLTTAVGMLAFVFVNYSYYIWWIIPLMMCGLACAYPTAVTIVSNRTSSEAQGEVLGVYQSVGAAAMGLSPLFIGSAIGAYPPLTAWGGAFCLILSSIGFWIGKRQKCPKLTGRIVMKGEPNYDKARLVSNYYVSKNKFPRVVVYCQNTQDVQNAVLWACCNNVSIRIRSGGHHHEGYSTGNGAILIDVSEMKALKVDKSTHIATIQPGLNNLELYSQLFKEGLTHVGGTCSEVGLSGLVLSGGMGPLLRRVGLTCDSLISVDMVDAKGQIIHATKDNEHKDLFWATCGGGGGNFGVITSMDIKVYPVTDVTWFHIGWDWKQPVDQIIEAWQDFFGKPDKNWFSHLDLWAKPFPAEELKKQPIKALGVFWGTPEKAREQLAPLLNVGKPTFVTIELVDWGKAINLIEDSTAVYLTNKPEYKSTGAFAMNNLPPAALKIIDTTLKESTSPLLNMLLFSMGGATSEIAPTDTAYFYREAKFFINYSIQWLKESEDQKQKIELTTLRQRLLPYTVGDYVGNPDPDLKDYLTSYNGANVDRLQCVKRKYDSENIFQFEQSVPPAPLNRSCSEK